MSPEIIFEDDSLLVINKPSGVVVNISKTSPEGTIQNWLQEKYGADPQDRSEFGQRNGVVHRIDKDTSGLLVIAKNNDVFQDLKSQFVNRKVEKEYIALVYGRVEDHVIRVDAPIKRNPKNRVKMAIVKDGRPAGTRFELIKNLEMDGMEFSLLKCFPETGRTHQIRVHLAALQHQIVGDSIYMTRKQLESTEELFSRLMLHAWRIKFKHPYVGKEVFFEADLPKEISRLYSKHH